MIKVSGCLKGMVAAILVCLMWLPNAVALADATGPATLPVGGGLASGNEIGGSMGSNESWFWYRDSTDKLIVKYSDAALARAIAPPAEHVAALSALAGVQLTHLRRMSGDSQVYLLPARMTLDEVSAIAQKLKGAPAVEYAEPDRLLFPQTAPNDPLYAQQWNLKSPDAPDNEPAGINVPSAWDLTGGSSSVVVGVLDTGIVDHDDLRGRTVPGYNFISDPVMAGNGVGRTPDPYDLGDWVPAEQQCGLNSPSSYTPSSWHGTLVAGIIGATSNNGTGMAGIVPNSKILPVRVVGKCGGYWSDIADGMRWAAGVYTDDTLPVNANPARVLNVSLGRAGACTPSVQSAIDDAVSAGAVVVVAAGNDSGAASLYTPGNCSGIITVTSVDRAGKRPFDSLVGPPVTIAAPGGGDVGSIITTSNTGLASPVSSPAGDSYRSVHGTSLAAAHVAGTASLMLSLNPALTPDRVSKLLQWSARPFPVVNNRYSTDCDTFLCGSGLLDAYRAVQAVSANAPVISSVPLALNFKIPLSGKLPGSQTLSLENIGSGTASWAAYSTVPWLRITPTSGVNGGIVTVSVDLAELRGAPRSEGAITIVSPGAVDQEVTIPVRTQLALDLHAPLPTPVSEHGLAAAGGKVYVIGGRGGADLVQIYDTATDTWSKGAAKPTPTFAINAAAIEGKIYVPGGWDTVANAVTDKLEVYDPSTDHWSAAARLPKPLSGANVEAVNGKLYVTWADDSSAYSYRYDPATDTWSSVAATPTFRWFTTSAAAGGKLYVTGGLPNAAARYTESFDPATGAWSREGDMAAGRALHAGAAADGKLFVLGGADSFWKEMDSIEFYSTSSRTWSELPFTLNVPRYGAKAVAAGGRMYVMGGLTYYRGSSDVNESFSVDESGPRISEFTLPSHSTSLTFPVLSLVAADDTGIMGYSITRYPTAPVAAAEWSATPPSDLTVSGPGLYSFYAWVRDAAGNVAVVRSGSVLVDLTPPKVAFTVRSAANTLNVPVKVYAYDYDSDITGYMIKEDPTPPLSDSDGWSVTPPTSFAFSSAGPKILYVWAKNGAGIVSDARTASVLIDTTPPTATFTAKSAVNTLTVPVAVAATDGAGGSGVAGYMISTMATPPRASSSGWSASAPTSYTCASLGINTLYLWVKDAAGNVSAARSARVNVDRLAPVVTVAMSSAANTLTVPLSFTASDGIGGSGVIGYAITTASTPPLAAATNWRATAPGSYTFSSTGPHVLYFWAKDAAGNVSKVQQRVISIDVTRPFVARVSVVTPAKSLRVPLVIGASDPNSGSGVNGYKVTTSLTPPLASATGWSATAGTSYTFTSAGPKTLYAWAKDRAGNVSAPLTVKVFIDTTAPTVTFTAKTPIGTLIVPVLLKGTDGTGGSGVTGYILTNQAPSQSLPLPAGPGWSATPPTSYTFTSKGVKTLYAWVKDAAGNLMLKTATVVIE